MMRSILKKAIVSLCFLGLAPGGLLAQDTLAHALLWEITGKDLSQPSYLFGTIHMIAKDDFFLAEEVRRAISQSEEVYFEINMDEMNDLGAMMSLMMDAFMKNDTTLRDLLSQEDYAYVEAHFRKIGLPLTFLQRIKPMFLTVLSSEDMSLSANGDGVASYEMEILALARDGEKRIGGLETAAYQMSMFDSIPYKVQADMLVQTIRDESGDSQQLDALVAMYKAQNLNGMERMFKMDPTGLGKYEHLLLATRNRNWIPVMTGAMATKSTFFAVGAGHLPGEEGVIRLLEREGYTLRPVSFIWPN